MSFFIDIKMPGINGVQTFREIKKIDRKAVVIMMTAYSVEDLVKEALEEGAYATVYKPFDVDKIIAIIADGRYEVRADIKQMLHFSYFDLTSMARPPFMNLDLIFCCNVLIYLQKQLQKRVLDKLYNSLHSQGYLILGESETPPDNLHEKLVCLDRKAKIYNKGRD